jgi:hypothetical protein
MDGAISVYRATLLPNNGMYPTADTKAFKLINGSGRRVMPGVGLLSLIIDSVIVNA